MTISWLALSVSIAFMALGSYLPHLAIVLIPFYLLVVCVGQKRSALHRRRA